MPVTPFHFGPGLLLHAMAPKRVSFVAFCATNVLIDVESLVNLVRGHDPVHAFFHTYVGATLAAAGSTGLILAGGAVGRALRVPDLFRWRELTPGNVTIGALLGAWSHVVLDSIMHADIRPLSPFSAANGLLHIVSLDTLHLGCLAAGAVGLLWLAFRGFRGRRLP